jgi:leader peptidase (prepilin peptidase)/N-methyltransferase
MIDFFLPLTTEPTLIIVFASIFGLVIGSFLNVVIYRLPLMQLHSEKTYCLETYCTELLKNQETTSSEPFNLAIPRSHCPHCKHQITAWENIPVFSYLWQGGKCTHCQQSISWRYPLIEILSALFAAVVAWKLGLSWQLLAALFLTWALLIASVIDIDHQILPDDIVLPFLWLGLSCNLFDLYTTITDSVIGAIAGYLILWTVFWIFKLITGKEGMGYGDFKLLALLGAWMGWQALPAIILLSSLVGAIVGITLILLKKHERGQPIPFGPYLAGAGWINLLWSDDILKIYFDYFSF